MITRYNYKHKAPAEKSEPIKFEYELVSIIEPISFNEDKTIKEYKEKQEYKVHKSKWSDFIKSFDLGSPSEQVINHLTKGTPLVTAHTLPHGDYTRESLLKGAELLRDLNSKGITLDMITEVMSSSTSKVEDKPQESEIN